MTDNNVNNEPDLKDDSLDVIEPLEIEETADEEIEIVDVGDVPPKEVDLNLGDEPFEIGMDTVEKMDATSQPAPEEIEDAGTDAPKKDVMLKDFDSIYESFMGDTNKKLILIAALVAIIGSFFVFCKISVGNDMPAQAIAVFFNGLSESLISRILSKICILAIIAVVVLVMIDLKTIASKVMLASLILYVIQCALFIFLSAASYAIPVTSLRPGLGFIITTLGILVMAFGVHKNKVTVRLYK